MIKEVTKNLQATYNCARSPLRESMQTGLNVTKSATVENPTSTTMATALATSNPTTVSLSDGSHTGYINGDTSREPKLTLTIKRSKATSDTTSIPSPSSKQEDGVKGDIQSGVPLVIHSEASYRHTAVNGKVLPQSSISHSTHGEQTKPTSKRTSNSANKRPKSASKRERSSVSKTNVLSINSNTPSVINGRPNSAERSHDPYQFSVKKEEESVLPPKKLRLDSSLNRLPDRSETFKDQATNTRNQGTTVDADLLGPCEPGTHINLDGYVCLETVTGMLMVSVVWRGRAYLGTLIDSSTHGFSPPVPPSYVYASQRYCSGIDNSGNSSSSNGNGRNQRGRGKRRCFTPATGARHSRKGRRNARGSPVSVTSNVSTPHSINPGDDSNEEPQSRGESPASENPLDDEEFIMRYRCPQSGCHKRFKDVKAMKFHHDECHTKRPCDSPSDSESREKRTKAVKSGTKNKKHSNNTAKQQLSNSQTSVVKTEPVTGSGVDTKNTKPTDAVTVKNESNTSDIISYFKTPVNNGISTSPPQLYSPTSPSHSHLPASPANGLKQPGGSGRSCSPETFTLHPSTSSHQVKSSPASSAQSMPPSQQEIPVRLPSTSLYRAGAISSSTISSGNSSSAPRTVAAVTVPVTTIPVMNPSTVASSSSVSSTSVSGGKKTNSKESKSGSGNSKSSNSRSHTSGTVSANTVTVPSVSSPLTSCQQTGTPSASLKPIQPKPVVAPVSSPSNGSKTANQTNTSPSTEQNTKRPNVNPSRKRKKSSGTTSEGGKRQSLSTTGTGARSSQGKPVQCGKRSTNSGSASEGGNAAQGDRASPAYSDISDDNESPIPILEKEGDVKLIPDTTGGCDEVGKTSEQASGSGGFYNTPPSLVPFSVYSADQSTATQGNGNTTGRTLNISNVPCRPGTTAKKASSPVVETISSGMGSQNKPNTQSIPGTSPMSLSTGQVTKKNEPVRVKSDFGSSNNPGDAQPAASTSVASVSSMLGNENEKSDSSKGQIQSRGDTISHTIEDQLRGKKNEPPNLTKISASISLSIPPTASTVTTPSSTPNTPSQGTVAKPTPLNPLSPSRSSDLPASTPAVVTPGPLVGGSRASDLYSGRPDHLPTPPSFHPAPPGAPFGPGAPFPTAHLTSPGALGPQSPFPPYTDTFMRYVNPSGPHGPSHPFSGYPYPAEPFFPSPPVSSAPQPHKIHELVEKGVVAATTASSTSNTPGIQTLCTSTSTTASSVANKPPVSVEPMDLQTAKSLADMAVAMRHHASIIPNHGGLPQGPTHAGMVPAHFPYSGGIPPAHMAAPPFAAMQQHTLPPPGHPPTPGPDAFFPPSTILNHPLYK